MVIGPHHKSTNSETCRIETDTASPHLPRCRAIGEVRRQQVYLHGLTIFALLLRKGSPQTDTRRGLTHRIHESGRELHATQSSTAGQREVWHMQYTEVDILGRGIERQRVVMIRGIDIQTGCQHATTLDVIRCEFEREAVAGRIEQQLHRRAIGHLQPLGDGISDGIEVVNLHIEQRVVVRYRLLARSLLPFSLGIAANKRQITPCRTSQIVEDGLITALRAERSIGKIGTQLHKFTLGEVFARHDHTTHAYLLIVVAIVGIRELDAAIQIVERTTTRLGHQTTRKFGN